MPSPWSQRTFQTFGISSGVLGALFFLFYFASRRASEEQKGGFRGLRFRGQRTGRHLMHASGSSLSALSRSEGMGWGAQRRATDRGQMQREYQHKNNHKHGVRSPPMDLSSGRLRTRAT